MLRHNYLGQKIVDYESVKNGRDDFDDDVGYLSDTYEGLDPSHILSYIIFTALAMISFPFYRWRTKGSEKLNKIT